MATKTLNIPFNDLLSNSKIMSDNIKLNAEKVGRYGLDLPAFTTEMDADILQANSLNQEQERLKSLLKSKTEELNEVSNKLTQNYSLSKKTVKMAEPQANWLAYGITDKK